MKYSDETISAIIDECGDFSSRFYTDDGVVRMVLRVLESTDEQKALRADAERYRWLRSPEAILIDSLWERISDSVDTAFDQAIDKAREA